MYSPMANDNIPLPNVPKKLALSSVIICLNDGSFFIFIIITLPDTVVDYTIYCVLSMGIGLKTEIRNI
jgi:hypothetical protein